MLEFCLAAETTGVTVTSEQSRACANACVWRLCLECFHQEKGNFFTMTRKTPSGVLQNYFFSVLLCILCILCFKGSHLANKDLNKLASHERSTSKRSVREINSLWYKELTVMNAFIKELCVGMWTALVSGDKARSLLSSSWEQGRAAGYSPGPEPAHCLFLQTVLSEHYHTRSLTYCVRLLFCYNSRVE